MAAQLSIFYTIDAALVCLILMCLMVVCIILGRMFARNRSVDYAENPGNTSIAASLYGLLGLLLAFTFGMSGDRFKDRKAVIVDEANAIGTAVLRIQLYDDSLHNKFKAGFRDYLETRIEYYEAHRDTVRLMRALKQSTIYGNTLWKIATDNSRIDGNLTATNQMIPALNAVLDISNTRYWGEYNRTPSSILTMLFLLSLCTSFVAGYTSVGKGQLDWGMALGFCAIVSVVVFFIIDLDKPRSGLINMDKNAKAITDLREMLK